MMAVTTIGPGLPAVFGGPPWSRCHDTRPGPGVTVADSDGVPPRYWQCPGGKQEVCARMNWACYARNGAPGYSILTEALFRAATRLSARWAVPGPAAEPVGPGSHIIALPSALRPCVPLSPSPESVRNGGAAEMFAAAGGAD